MDPETTSETTSNDTLDVFKLVFESVETSIAAVVREELAPKCNDISQAMANLQKMVEDKEAEFAAMNQEGEQGLITLQSKLNELQTGVEAVLTGDARNKDTVTIRFSIPYRCDFGQHLRVIGSCDTLGNWDLQQALPMVWNEGDVWSAEVKLPADQEMNVEYKYVVCGADGNVGTAWKPGNNFVIALPGGGNGSVKVKDAWDEASREVQIETIKNAAKGRRTTGNGSDEGSSDGSGDDALAAISIAADSALEQLEAAVAMSLDLLESNTDVASIEMLAADRLVAAAAQRAASFAKALDVAASPRGSEAGGSSNSSEGA